jgi:hypothetical protein
MPNRDFFPPALDVGRYADPMNSQSSPAVPDFLVSRVRPLLGGLEAWKEQGYPLQKLGKEPVDPASPRSERLETTS